MTFNINVIPKAKPRNLILCWKGILAATMRSLTAMRLCSSPFRRAHDAFYNLSSFLLLMMLIEE
jgi:hypothetical protein